MAGSGGLFDRPRHYSPATRGGNNECARGEEGRKCEGYSSSLSNICHRRVTHSVAHVRMCL